MTTTTPNLGFQNWFSTTLSSGITATDTVIYLNSLPTPSEGFLVIEPDSDTNREIIFYNSKGANFVTVPTTGDRGVGGTTAVSHSSGVTVQMNVVAEHFEALQDGTAINADTLALSQINGSNEFFPYDFVASGCVWTGDSYGSTLAASMTAGVVYINGVRVSVSAVTARAFTASKDTYVDVLNNAGSFSLVYTEVTNNAASPALAANSIRLAIIVTGASNIANAGSVNQGEQNRVLPIASSVAYTVTDSLGNLICNRTPNPTVIGYRQITSNSTTTSASAVQVTGLTCPVIVPTGRKIKVTAHTYSLANSSGTNTAEISIWDGTVASGTRLQVGDVTAAGAGSTGAPATISAVVTPSTASKTYNAGKLASGGTTTVSADSTAPAYISVELV